MLRSIWNRAQGSDLTEAVPSKSPRHPARRVADPAVHRCRVSANGVPAEWVEVAAATPGQPTIMLLDRGGRSRVSLEGMRGLAADLAILTGARVLSVACVDVADGAAAYAWLLAEGVDLDTTTFFCTDAGDSLPGEVRVAAQELRLPLPNPASQ